MSLLMDALKRAEEEKRKAAEDTQKLSAGGQHPSIDDETGAGRPADALPEIDTSVMAGPHREPPPEATTKLSLEPMEFTGDHGVAAARVMAQLEESGEGTSGPEQPTPGDQDAVDTSEREYLELEIPTNPGQPRIDGYDQESTLPSQRAVQSSLRDYFDASQSQSRSQSQGMDGSSVEIPGDVSVETGLPEPEIGLPEATHATAQTVFAAKSTAGPARYVKMTMLLVVVLGLALAGAGYFYYASTPSVMPAPSPFVAQSVETLPDESRLAVAIAPPPRPAEPEIVEPLWTEVLPVEPEPVEAQVAVQIEAAPEPMPEPEVPAAAVAPPAREEAMIEPLVPVNIEELLAERLANVAARPSGIQITKSKGAPQVSATVSEAFQAYRAGDAPRAESLYRSILRDQPDHRDALLGIAAIAGQTGRRELAYTSYMHLLRLNPRDAVAAAGLYNLAGNAVPGLDESQLKLMMDSQPATPQVYFSLGTQYARQGRWAEAQQAFFDAYSRDQQNADFAFNLAVSLDHLGQGGTALDYYRIALDLADRGPAGFPTSEALARIQGLSHRIAQP